jgi:CheY-like chemotaxis protein
MSEKKQALLVVDDTPVNLDILLEALGDEYIVRVGTDGVTALESVQNAPPDLILLDVMMPGMDGFEVCRRLKSDPETLGIPVIFLTALNSEADEAIGLGLGAVDYVTKPFNPALVRTRVRNHLELKRHKDHLEGLVRGRTRDLAAALERVRELSQLKDDFLNMISHEIRTPANGVVGIGELLIDMCPNSEKRARFSDLFHESSRRLLNLIEDAATIADLFELTKVETAATSFLTLLEDVQNDLPDIQIDLIRRGTTESMHLRGAPALLKKALETTVRLAAAFSIDKQKVRMAGIVEDAVFRVQIEVDALSLSADEAVDFFKIESLVRSASYAESLGLAPVLAHKLLAAFGGELRFAVGEGNAGHVEALFPRDC